MDSIQMVQVKVRLGPELKRFIEAEAIRNQSSMGSEIARAIRERKDKTENERAASARS